MEIVQVLNKKDEKLFMKVPLNLYNNDPQWIRPLDQDVEDVFNQKKNKTFRFGKMVRWILKDKEQKLIGRIAAFTNSKYKNKGDDFKVGGIGFFECINQMEAARFLLDAARDWLKQQGMQAMDGPINFGERDRWWGLLVSGFDAPLYGMNYNPPYYKELFEQYGLQVYYHQLCFGMNTSSPLSEKMIKWHRHYEADPDFSVEHIRKNELERYASDFCTVYNKAWAKHGEGKTMDIKQAKLLFKKMKPVLDEDITWFVYHKGEPIGMWINLPDLNQYFKHFNGRFGLIQKLHFLWLHWRGTCNRFVGIVYGIVPEWQGKGTDAYMIEACNRKIQEKKRYKKYEMQWIGDFNPKMVNLAQNLDAVEVRRLSTYRYLFDREQPFHRHPFLK